MRNVLITGGAGFIGSNFTHHWVNNYPDDQIYVLDALTYAGNRKNLDILERNSRIEFIEGDICDEGLVDSLMQNKSIDTIVHFAAESHVDRSIHGPDAFIQTNIIGTHILLKCAKKQWLDKNLSEEHHFHHVSTDEVYGSLEFDEPAFTENTAYDPSSPYSSSKASSDHLVRAYHRTYGLNVTISNCSNNYGPYHFPEKLIPLTIINILNGRQIPVYGQGKNIRDWLYVTDHCRGIEAILENGANGETYNIGGNCEISNIEVVNTLCELIDLLLMDDAGMAEIFPLSAKAKGLRSDSLIEFVEDRPGHDLRYAIDTSKIENELGFSPKESFESGLKKTIDWYIANKDWWMELLNDNYKDWLFKNYESRD